MQASTAQLQAFGVQVARQYVAATPASLLGQRVVDLAGRTAASKLRAQGYSAVQANVAALAASAHVTAAAQ